MKRCIWAIMLIVIVAVTTFGFLCMNQEGPIQQPNLTNRTAELPTKHIIEGVPYIPMYEYWATCAITSLDMQLRYFGADYPLPLLMNIDWAYGAVYLKTPQGPFLYPNASHSIDTILYTAEMLGCNVTEINNQDEEAAWKTLKGFLAQDIPVIIQWSFHTVLVVGYDESPSLSEPLVIYHNPAPPSWFLDPSYPGGKPEGFNSTLGAYANMSLDKWMGPYIWGNEFSYPPKRYEMIVVKPAINEPIIPWDEVMTRNANKTLALGEWASYPLDLWYGCVAIRQVPEDIYLARLAEVFRQIADYEEMAGNALMKGAKGLTIDQ